MKKNEEHYAPKKELDKDSLLDLLHQINSELRDKNLFATVNIYGGCAMMLSCYDSRRSWDLDGVLLGPTPQQTHDIICSVAKANNLTSSFLT